MGLPATTHNEEATEGAEGKWSASTPPPKKKHLDAEDESPRTISCARSTTAESSISIPTSTSKKPKAKAKVQDRHDLPRAYHAPHHPLQSYRKHLNAEDEDQRVSLRAPRMLV